MEILSINYPKQKKDMKKIKYMKRNYDALILDLNQAEQKRVVLPPPELSNRIF